LSLSDLFPYFQLTRPHARVLGCDRSYRMDYMSSNRQDQPAEPAHAPDDDLSAHPAEDSTMDTSQIIYRANDLSASDQEKQEQIGMCLIVMLQVLSLLKSSFLCFLWVSIDLHVCVCMCVCVYARSCLCM
jgi:hypothetical protein